MGSMRMSEGRRSRARGGHWPGLRGEDMPQYSLSWRGRHLKIHLDQVCGSPTVTFTRRGVARWRRPQKWGVLPGMCLLPSKSSIP